MKTFLLMTVPIAIVVAFLASGAAGQTATRSQLTGVGFVNPQRLLAEANATRAEVARAQAVQQQKVAELRTKQQALEVTRQQLAQSTDPAARLQLQQQEFQQRTEFERATAQAQLDIQALQRQLQGELLAKVRPVVEEIAKSKNLEIVLNGDSAVVWAPAELDITTAVIERMNANASKP